MKNVDYYLTCAFRNMKDVNGGFQRCVFDVVDNDFIFYTALLKFQLQINAKLMIPFTISLFSTVINFLICGYLVI